MTINAANEKDLGTLHSMFTGLLTDHLKTCIYKRELPEPGTMNVIKGFLKDNNVTSQTHVADLQNRTARVIDMQKQFKRKPNAMEAEEPKEVNSG